MEVNRGAGWITSAASVLRFEGFGNNMQKGIDA